jgi:hypothetical protein
MAEKEKATPEKKVAGVTEIVGATSFECATHDVKFNNIQELQAHLKEETHEIGFGNYPCKICGKTVTIVPNYIDKPSPESGLPADNTEVIHKQFLMVSKRPTANQVAGGLGVCDNCKEELKKQLA